MFNAMIKKYKIAIKNVTILITKNEILHAVNPQK